MADHCPQVTYFSAPHTGHTIVSTGSLPHMCRGCSAAQWPRIWRGKRINLHFYLQKFWLLNRKKHVQYTLCAHACLCVCVVCVLSGFSHVWLFVNPWTIALQAPLFMGFSKQEYWNGLSLPPPGIFPTQGLNLNFLCLMHYRQVL